MNIVWPGSHCPRCGHPIRWFDNIPVLSWMVLRGRCRDCHAPISIRSPLVEAGTAVLFGVLAAGEILRHGVNVPVRALGSAGAAAPLRTLPELLGLYTYHLVLLCTLLAAALIACDKRRPPWPLFVPALLVGLLAPLGWPELHPVPAWPGLADCPLAGLIDGGAGLLAGAVLGGLAALVCRGPHGGAAGDLWGGAACVGVVLGWQSACPLVLLAMAVYGAVRIAARWEPEIDRLPAAAWLGLLTLCWVVTWARLDEWARLFWAMLS
jgi:leader peptidase (prepilin peptidase)/N-methyltransferase